MQHRLITPTITALTKPVRWNSSTFSSLQWALCEEPQDTSGLIGWKSNTSHPSLIPIISMEGIQPAPEHICSISELSSLPLDYIHFEEKKPHLNMPLSSIYLNQNKAWADPSPQQSKPHKDYWRQYLDADHTILLDRKIALKYFAHM